ncbi:hypothetical protein OSTOST_11025, partial [Ostertagia ostertagi]
MLICRTPSLHNAFGYICASHLIADIGQLLIFSLWCASTAILGLPDTVTSSYFGGKIGQLSFITL